ncbi:MAG: hypothetical protein HOP19_10935 [Acidobacteria bacterium]|nr:hypothetical protein [Acidobacteriota bacterium]
MKQPDDDQSASFDDGNEVLLRRLRRNTFIVIGLALAASLIFSERGSDRRMFLGVVLGGALCFFNLRWLNSSLRSILALASQRQDGRVPPFTAGKFIFRYYLVAVAIGAAVWTGEFHPLGIGSGFAAFVGGVMIEAVYQFYLALKR